jgi:flavin reductase (DIM6/NTAB) family NADH-FMN oxidoreductase RutF
MVTSDQFRKVMGNFATGITVVTTYGADRQPYGLTVNAFTSVSLEPILVLVCLDNRLSGLQYFKDSKHFGVSVLSEAQEDMSRLFAKKDSARPPSIYLEGKTGVPLLKDCIGTLECETVAVYPGGDHQIILGQVLEGDVRNDKIGALLYFRGKYQRLNP